MQNSPAAQSRNTLQNSRRPQRLRVFLLRFRGRFDPEELLLAADLADCLVVFFSTPVTPYLYMCLTLKNNPGTGCFSQIIYN